MAWELLLAMVTATKKKKKKKKKRKKKKRRRRICSRNTVAFGGAVQGQSGGGTGIPLSSSTKQAALSAENFKTRIK